MKQTATIFNKQHYIQQMIYVCNCIPQGVQHGLQEIIVDNFAGGGGASTGIEMATGHSVYAAINHDPEAIRMHKANHPSTKHYCESVWDVDPLEVCGGHPVGLAWFSPDCKHFSKAKGGKPVEKKIRGLAWIVLKWAAFVRPRVIMLENVEEFQTWGPCIPQRDEKTGRIIVNIKDYQKNKKDPHTRVAKPGEVISVDKQIFTPDPKRKGQTYRRWKRQLKNLGYKIETKELVAADYGAPTMRKRFFMIARCDGQPIIWPEPTHAPRDSIEVKAGLLQPYAGAYTQIDFSRPCPSIFDTVEEIKEKYGLRAQRPLADNTMQRIARGLQKFVIGSNEPFIVQVNHSGSDWHYTKNVEEPLPVITGKHGFGVAEAKVTPYISVNRENHFGSALEEPIHTVTGSNQHMLMTPTLIQYHSETVAGEVRGQALEGPVMTVDGSNRYGLVSAFISKYYAGETRSDASDVSGPLHTITARQGHAVCATHLVQMNNHCDGRDITNPIPTITAGDGHFGEVRAFLIKYYGNGTPEDIIEPLDTVTSRDRFGLVTIQGVDYAIVDIGLRMLEPKELYGCQGFPEDYVIDRDCNGKSYSRTEQVKRCGNAVCPPVPAAMVKSNLPELCTAERLPICRLDRVKQEQTGQLCFA